MRSNNFKIFQVPFWGRAKTPVVFFVCVGCWFKYIGFILRNLNLSPDWGAVFASFRPRNSLRHMISYMNDLGDHVDLQLQLQLFQHTSQIPKMSPFRFGLALHQSLFLQFGAKGGGINVDNIDNIYIYRYYLQYIYIYVCMCVCVQIC